MIALVGVAVVVLALVPAFFGVRSTMNDPVFASLDALAVPGWAAAEVEDNASGNRFCVLDCTFRERAMQSQQPVDDTEKAYTAALTQAGWKPWKVASCPEQPISDGKYSCWQRDEYTLDLWVRLPECAVDAVTAQDPEALPSGAPDGSAAAPPDPADCNGSTVSIKVQNAISDGRGRPQEAPDPSQLGETPDPVLTNDPLLEPTPETS